VAADRGRSRRVSIPGVAELLRSVAPDPVASDERQATGREKHDQKITVYLSAAELLDLEHARLALRRFGFADVVASEHDILDGIAWSMAAGGS